jgi:hypothetical protein
LTQDRYALQLNMFFRSGMFCTLNRYTSQFKDA